MTIPSEDRPTAAPPVVAVMVVHEPGPWFAETLQSLASQTYPDLRLVALLSGSTPQTAGAAIREHCPAALVRQVEGNPGFGPVVNQALSLVDGRDGFFLVLHDDVALQPDAVSRLVEEAFRSNAALVGPKLVEWDAPDVLQHVGREADRSGRLVEVVEPGERDQEQHDAVRDVFALHSACLLIRNDVFRTVSGFAPNIPFLGEDLDLCWRVHMLGARVVVNPAAVVRHRGAFETRATIVQGEARQERHRVRTALICSSLAQLPLLAVRLLLGALLDLVFGLVDGKQQRGFASLRAVGAIFVDLPLIAERRRAVRPLRRVPGREVASLQLRGSARITAFRRHRRAIREQQVSERPIAGAPESSTARGAALVALAVVVLVLLGNRGFVWGGIDGVGQFVPVMHESTSPLDAFRTYFLGWSPGWFGSTGPTPTFVGVMAVFGLVFFGNWAGLLTAIVVASFFVAWAGAWRLCGVCGDKRARMFGAVVYLAVPIGILAARDGRRDALILWALLPWILDFTRRIAGLSRDDASATKESSVRSAGSRRAQLVASLLLVVAAAATFDPASSVVVVILTALLFVALPFTATPWRASWWLLAAPLGAVLGSAVLHVPWSIRFVSADWWTAIVGPPVTASGASILDILSFGVDNVAWRWMIVGAYVPVVVAPLLARGARAAWPIRAFALVAGWLALRLAEERSLVGLALPEPLMLASIAALGLALAATFLVAELLDAQRSTFTWRRLVSAVTIAAIVVACLPSVVASFSGRWSQPADTLGRLVAQLPDDGDGDYSVLYLGDSRLMAVSTVDRGAGVAYGIVSDEGASGVDTLAAQPSTMTETLERAVEVLVTGESLRAGRLLAPLAVRFVVIPLRDATLYATPAAKLDAVGPLLVARLADQLDFRRVYTATDLVIFENIAALPGSVVLDERSAVASQQATETVLLADPLTIRSVLLSALSPINDNTGRLQAGTVHLAVPYSDRWTLNVDGARIAPRVAFGATTAFDAPVAGEATLQLQSSLGHRGVVVLQLALWLMVLAITFNPGRFRGRVRAARQVVEVSLRSDEQRPGSSS